MMFPTSLLAGWSHSRMGTSSRSATSLWWTPSVRSSVLSFETVSLSSRTVRRHIEEMSQLACVPDDVEPDTCVSVVASMREEFASRFAGIKPLAVDFKLFTAPFDFPVDDAPAPCIWSWWSYSAMVNWRRSSTTLRHCPSSATSPSLLGIFLHSLRMFNAS